MTRSASHQRSSSTHGPAHAIDAPAIGAVAPIHAGMPVSRPRPVSVHGVAVGVPQRDRRASSCGSASRAGDGAGTAPGHGSAGLRALTLSSPHGTRVIRSPAPRPPESTGASTDSGPSKPCTRANAHPAR